MSQETPGVERHAVTPMQLGRILADEAWHGRWNPNESLNPLPQANHTAAVLLDALTARGLLIVDVTPTRNEPHRGAGETLRIEGPCALLTCLADGPHEHPICNECSAVNHGNAFCAGCRAHWPPTGERTWRDG